MPRPKGRRRQGSGLRIPATRRQWEVHQHTLQMEQRLPPCSLGCGRRHRGRRCLPLEVCCEWSHRFLVTNTCLGAFVPVHRP